MSFMSTLKKKIRFYTKTFKGKIMEDLLELVDNLESFEYNLDITENNESESENV